MGELNLSDQPNRRQQTSTNVAPSPYSVLAIESAISGSYVLKVAISPWTAATGTAARTTFTTYTAPTISATPTQAQVQALADHAQVLSQRLKALVDDLKARGAI